MFFVFFKKSRPHQKQFPTRGASSKQKAVPFCESMENISLRVHSPLLSQSLSWPAHRPSPIGGCTILANPLCLYLELTSSMRANASKQQAAFFNSIHLLVNLLSSSSSIVPRVCIKVKLYSSVPAVHVHLGCVFSDWHYLAGFHFQFQKEKKKSSNQHQLKSL